MSALPSFPPGGIERSQTVLLVSPLEDDHSLLRRILRHSFWRLEEASTVAEGVRSLERRQFPVVISSDSLPDEGWRQILQKVLCLNPPPRVLVSSRLAEDSLWAEVLNLGGYDVILTPFVAGELFRVLHLAWCSWSSERERTGKPAARFRGPAQGKYQSAVS